MAFLKRIKREYDTIQKDDNTCRVELIDQNMQKWYAFIDGPSETPFEKGEFKLELTFTNSYPFKPPEVKFITRIFHPNISEQGSICLDILKSQWTPSLTISKLLLSISSLLAEPNAKDPLNPQAGNLYLNNLEDYNKKVKTYTNTYCLNLNKNKYVEEINKDEDYDSEKSDY
jgi:ubiquitin-conjugating enzyme E2 D/E